MAWIGPKGLNRYSYSLSNPIRHTDPSGHWVESAVDAAFILYDLWDISQNGLSWESGLSLAADVGGLLLPVVTGGGAAVRAAFHADDAAKVVAHADDALKAFNAADNLGDAGKTVENAVGAYCSFSADTLVATDEGLAPISTIAPGELVLAYHEGLQATGYYTVTASWAHVDLVMLEVTLAGETLEVTPEHPFYVVGHGWLTAADLWPGAEIFRADGEAGAVVGVRALAQPQAMYNLTVAEAHTYFVGAQQWLVHNACDGDNLGQALATTANSALHQLPERLRRSTVGAALDDAGKPVLSVYNQTQGGTIEAVGVLRDKGWNVLDAPPGRGPDFHAERQLYEAGYNDIGISRQRGMCDACGQFFSAKPWVRIAPYLPME